MKVYLVSVEFSLGKGMSDQQAQVFSDRDYAKHVFDEKVDDTIATVANFLHGKGLPIGEDEFEYLEDGKHDSGVIAQWRYNDEGRFARVSLEAHPLIETALERTCEEVDVFPLVTDAVWALKNRINMKLARLVDEHYDENDGNSNILYTRSSDHNGIVENFGEMTDVLAVYHTRNSLSFLISSPDDREQSFAGLWEFEPEVRRKLYDFITKGWV